MDFEHDAKNNIHARIDRKRKFPVTTLLKCLLSNNSLKYLQSCEKKKIDPDPRKIQGMTAEEILNFFYASIHHKKNKYGWQFPENLTFLKGKILNYNLLDSNTGKTLFLKGSKISQKLINDTVKKKINSLTIEGHSLIGQYLSSD